MHINGNDFRAKAAFAIAAAFALSAFSGRAIAQNGAVYTTTNSAGGNAVVVYDRAANGRLSGPVFVGTGGYGTGSGLGSQGAIALSDSGHWVLAVNAGSNDVTVFQVGHNGLTVADRQPSGGTMPISIAMERDLVFVLNAGGTANITGFRLSAKGNLVPLPGSTRVLPGMAPAQVSFALHGAVLVVTEKGSNTITTFPVDDGTVGPATTHASAGATPFGFAVAKFDVLVVTEAAGGAPGGSTISSYRTEKDGSVTPVTSSLSTGETAACWAAVTDNGKYAYIANTGSSSISSLEIGQDDSLTLLEAAAGHTPPGTPTVDLAFSVNSKFLYGLAGNTISAFRVAADGTLAAVQTTTLPASAVGLAAR